MNRYIKKTLIAIGLFFILIPLPARAQQEPVSIYFFRGEGCPHCAAEEKFLDGLAYENRQVQIYDYEIWYNSDNAKLIRDIVKNSGLNIAASGVPLTFIGERVIAGYLNDSTTGAEIKGAVDYYTAIGDPDVIGDFIKNRRDSADKNNAPKLKAEKKLPIITLPLFGEIQPQNFSLFALSVMIGAIDGFNPCAMWVLIFLISMLLGMKNKRRMWTIGFTFIAASGLVYFVFMSAWLNIFLFIGFLFWMRLAIGLVALGSGWYHLRSYFKNKEGACEVAGVEKRRQISDKIKSIIQEKSFILAMAGIIILAAAVNMVELICSAGLPAVYTSILSAADLSAWQYYAYLLLYVFIFMLDDLAVFIIAMLTMRIAGAAKSYVRWANLAGGIIMLIIGILLIFKPSWLLFG